jgi:hypothetical protein
MDFMVGYLLRMICHRFALPLPVFRGSKGPIQEKLSLQQLRRPLHIHTPLVSANAVNMWCMECVSISYRMRLLDRAPVCMGGEGFFAAPRHRALHRTLRYPTLPYPDQTYRTLPACPCTMPIFFCVSLTCPISLCLCLSVIVGWQYCIALCSP